MALLWAAVSSPRGGCVFRSCDAAQIRHPQVIRSKLMVELGYEAAICREVAVLRQMKHPGVARLVASFRWHEDVYLLLE